MKHPEMAGYYYCARGHVFHHRPGRENTQSSGAPLACTETIQTSPHEGDWCLDSTHLTGPFPTAADAGADHARWAASQAARCGAEGPRLAHHLPPYEGMDRSRPFYETTVEEQRDELLALAGVLVPYLSEHLPPGRWPLMDDLVREAGHRLGPWSR